MALSLALPSTSLAGARPSSVAVSPLPLASILDHHLRRGHDQDRVFGTLLGVRNEETGEVSVRTAFGVPYAITGKEVILDVDHHRALVDLHVRVNPREHVVGWYATDPKINSFSALIHAFFTAECAAHGPAIHLILDPSTLAFAAYAASPIGTSSRTSSVVFVPLEATMRVHEQERPGIELLSTNLQQQSNLHEELPIQSPLASLYGLLGKVSTMLDTILEYVRAVNAGEREGDARVGRALLETVGSVPRVAAATAATNGVQSAPKRGTKSFDEEFNDHLADVLMVSYLANLISTQAEIASRLNLMV